MVGEQEIWLLLGYWAPYRTYKVFGYFSEHRIKVTENFEERDTFSNETLVCMYVCVCVCSSLCVCVCVCLVLGTQVQLEAEDERPARS